MMNKVVAGVVSLIFLLFLAAPGMAMLRVLEPELSGELQAIAREHLAVTQKADIEAIIVESAWLREFWNIKVDVYMVEAVVNKGLASERKVEVPVRVDQKLVLSPAELSALEEEDRKLAPAEPQMRILTAEQQPEVIVAPAQDASLPAADYTGYYLTAAAMLTILGFGSLAMRRKA
ncbi:MAG: hypothetical protein DDT21_01666 [Syntrophomonadaceae bacterium]|nr:hypothetical protein [Bacillota bacterium]